jgi:signal transduction histidine kinase
VLATFWMTAVALLVLAVLLYATRRFTSYLPELALAAERVGRGGRLPPIEERGPRELRRVSRAFNAMQLRVSNLLEERNAMLGALSHDARTLIARLALRLDKVEDEALRRKVEEDVSAVTQLLEEALAFARDDASDEPRKPLDLSSMLQTLVDDERDRGADASFIGPNGLLTTAQPVALKRAFVNVIDNAIRYGGAVRVELSIAESDLCIDVLDPGPGIPPEHQARALKPYERLDASRNRETGGTGLGLAIASNVVERHGGRLALSQVDAGFRVRIVLPAAQGPRRAQASHQK